MKIASLTHPGRIRKRNEDCLFVDEALGLLAVADGMGGYNGGEIASSLAVRTVHESLLSSSIDGGSPPDWEPLIREAARRADQAIRLRAAEDAQLLEMGTTLVLALCRASEIHLTHAGDSRAYLLQEGAMRCLTRDHSLVNEMIDNGEITPKEARRHPLRNVITRSLGSHGSAELDFQTVTWESGDRLLLCSDGLTNMVEDRGIQELILCARTDLPLACEKLVQAANRAGGKDNISVILALRE